MVGIICSPYFWALVAALLPAVLLFLYIYNQDSINPEPIKWLWKGVWYGVLSAVIVVTVLGLFFDTDAWSADIPIPVVRAILDAFFCAAIPEETAKLIMLWLLLRKNPYFDEHLDGIVYATCVGLGFAGFENIFYVIGNMENLVSIAVVRGLFSVPGHFFFAVAMGYFISLACFKSRTEIEKKKYYLLAFLVPMILHGIFDTLLMVSSVDESLAGICIIAFLYFTNKLRKKGQERIHQLKLFDENSKRK